MHFNLSKLIRLNFYLYTSPNFALTIEFPNWIFKNNFITILNSSIVDEATTQDWMQLLGKLVPLKLQIMILFFKIFILKLKINISQIWFAIKTFSITSVW